MMNYSKYQYVVIVAEMQSISKAARVLYMSQPALTKYINKLEEEIGVRLFNRNVIPITLTYAGERFVAEAKKILELKSHLDKELEEISGFKKGRLSIGISASRGEMWLPDIFPVFKKRYPGIELKIVEGSYDYLEEQVSKDLLDIILTTLPLDSEELNYEVLSEEQIILVVPYNHSLLEGKNISENSLENLIYIDPGKLNGVDFISLTPGSGINRMSSQLFELHGVRPHIILETQSIDTAFKLATRGMGMAFCSDLCVIDYFPDYLPALCRISDTPLKRKSIAGFKKGQYLSQTAAAFIKTTKDVLSTSPTLKGISHDEYVNARSELETNNTFLKWIKTM